MKSVKINWPLIGNEHVKYFLTKSVVNQKIANSYIFLGPNDMGKTTLANYFAKVLLCQKNDAIELPCGTCSSCLSFDKQANNKELSAEVVHGDYHLIKKEADKKNISIEQVREFIKNLSMSSFLGSYKIGIIKNAENLSREAANALLKTLEEPRERVVVILIAKSIESLPATIASRSEILNFYPVENNLIHEYLEINYKASKSQAKNLSRLCLGRPALAVKFFEDKDFLDRYLEKAKIFLDILSSNINERFIKVENLIGVKAQGVESGRSALWILDAWRGVVRDLLLLNMGHNNLVQHEIFEESLYNMKDKLSTGKALELIKSFDIGEEYIKANVNPKIVLENIVMNI